MYSQQIGPGEQYSLATKTEPLDIRTVLRQLRTEGVRLDPFCSQIQELEF